MVIKNNQNFEVGPWFALCIGVLKRSHIGQSSSRKQGETLVEFALLLPVVAFFIFMSFLFYQGFVQGNLYGRNAQKYNYYMAEENPAYGQEMAVALPFP